MLGFGGIIRHTTAPAERSRIPISNGHVAPIPSTPFTPPPAAFPTQDEDQTPGQISQNKISPSDISADSLRVEVSGTSGEYVIENTETLTSKIYFQKKQFVWEFVDTQGNDIDKQRKKRIEVKFGDIMSIAIKAHEGHPGSLIIVTNKPLSLYKEKQNAPGKNTQWDKSEEFMNGFDKPREGGTIKLTTYFAKDALTRKPGKISHLEKLLSSDSRIKHMIESNPDSSFEQVKDVISDTNEEVVEEPSVQNIDVMNAVTLGDRQLTVGDIGVSQEYMSIIHSDDLNHKPIEDLVELVTKELKTKPSQGGSSRKQKFWCPMCKALKFETDANLRDHLYQKHKNLVELGFDVLPSGHFKASPLFLVNVLVLCKSKPQLLRTIMKNSINFDYDA